MNGEEKQVRVRIAPSPTGFLHVGTARAALFNYLYARSQGGRFILRIDDTDLERSDRKFEVDIVEGLKWLGLEWDEGPDVGGGQRGDFGPYRQSERLGLYRKYIDKLLEDDQAYYCFCSVDDLEQERGRADQEGRPQIYSGRCNKLTRGECEKLRQGGRVPAVRLRVSEGRVIKFDDRVRGLVEFNTDDIGDFVIAKADGTALYNFSSVIDDHEMKISHVIRGEDHLSNTPKQILVQKALGLNRVKYAHLPLILNEDRTKLSKRKNAVSVREYEQQGYLPEAILNFLAFLGWHPKAGSTEEFFSIDQLIARFSLKGIQKSPAVFDLERLDYLNGHYIRKMSDDAFFEKVKPYVLGMAKEFFGAGPGDKKLDDLTDEQAAYVRRAVLLEKERVRKFSEVPDLVGFMFVDEGGLEYEPELIVHRKSGRAEALAALEKGRGLLADLGEDDFTEEKLEQELRGLAEKGSINTGALLWGIRAALSGREASPGVFELLTLFGRERSLARIDKAISRLE